MSKTTTEDNKIISDMLEKELENSVASNSSFSSSNDHNEDEGLDDYEYIDDDDDFDLNLIDEIDYRNLLSQFFEDKTGENNITDILSSINDSLMTIKHSIDQNTKCIMKLCSIKKNEAAKQDGK